MSVREERRCEMMMGQDGLENPTPDSICRVRRSSTREITRDIFARKIFPASGHVSSRDVPVLVPDKAPDVSRGLHVADSV